ncbi:MAG: inositol monophosphatase family protein [Halobacteriota archaeon]
MELSDIVTITTRAMRAVLAYTETEADYSAITQKKKRDVTRRFDLVAEEALQKELSEREVSARVVSEEYGDRIVGRDPDCTLIFDPVDGSTNVAIGFPYFCSSLAYAPKVEDVCLSDITAGVIVTNALDVYAAEHGRARLNAAPLTTEKAQRYKPIIAGYAYGVSHVPYGLIELEKQCIVRIFGSIAYDLCNTAAGTLDAVVDTRGRLSSYDIAAGQLIVRACGGMVTTEEGTPLDARVTDSDLSLVCSADAALHARIIEILSRFAPAKRDKL